MARFHRPTKIADVDRGAAWHDNADRLEFLRIDQFEAERQIIELTDEAGAVRTAHQYLIAIDQRIAVCCVRGLQRSEEHTSELQSLMRISYAVFCLKKKKTTIITYLMSSNSDSCY